jgi:alpha-N-arabinofuranosidase
VLSASLTIDPAFEVAPVRRNLFGAFVEQAGRCVYGGLVEPGHPSADEHGLRGDVVELVRRLGISTVRYPGGNFVSGYRWEDGVGPVDERPARLDLAWGSTEPNTFGLNEFMTWTRRAEVEPMLAVNLGTRGVQEALDLLEYCNVRGGTRLSDLRRRHGVEQPHDVRMWCLGNEMDGTWQVGHKTAPEYGRLAAETARAMRMIDPELVLVACGSSATFMDTFPSWERIVLEEAYEQIDLISAHAYYCEKDGDLASFLACSTDLEHQIETVVATADYVRSLKRSSKQLNISFDEWNVWYQHEHAGEPRDWSRAGLPRLEDHYNVADAVVVGSLLIALLRHSDRVHAASLAQLVNVIAPIMTVEGGPAWRQSTFHPFEQTSRLAAGVVLRTAISAPSRPTEKYGDVSVIDAVATHDADAGTTALFIINRSTADEIEISIDTRAVGAARVRSATVLSDTDPHARPTVETERRFEPRPLKEIALGDGALRLTAPPVSWIAIELEGEDHDV